MDRTCTILGILGGLALIIGAILILANFNISMSRMMKPGFLTTEKWQVGLISLGLIAFGLGVFGWLSKDVFLGLKQSDKQKKRPGTEAYRARKDTSYKGTFLFLLLATIIGAILYYAIWG